MDKLQPDHEFSNLSDPFENEVGDSKVTIERKRYLLLVLALSAGLVLAIVSTAIVTYYIVKINNPECLQMVTKFSELKGKVKTMEKNLMKSSTFADIKGNSIATNIRERQTKAGSNYRTRDLLNIPNKLDVQLQLSEFKENVQEMNKTMANVVNEAVKNSTLVEYMGKLEHVIDRVHKYSLEFENFKMNVNQTSSEVENSYVKNLKFETVVEVLNQSIIQSGQDSVEYSDFQEFREMVDNTVESIENSILQKSNFKNFTGKMNSTIKMLKLETIGQQNISGMIQSDMAALSNKVEGLLQKKMIGFTIKFRSGTRFNNGSTVKFDEVVSNYGNGYSTTTGRFECQTAGMYMFQFNLISNSREAKAFILKNGLEVAFAYTSGDTNTNYDSGSASFVTNLNAGDNVWVESNGDYEYDKHSSFSGLLIAFMN